MSAAIERLALQAAALRHASIRELPSDVCESLVAIAGAGDGPSCELVDRLRDHHRLIGAADDALTAAGGALASAVPEGEITGALARASVCFDAALVQLAMLAPAEAAVADLEWRAVEDLRRADTVGLT